MNSLAFIFTFIFTFISLLSFSFATLSVDTSSSCGVCTGITSSDCLETLFIVVQSFKENSFLENEQKKNVYILDEKEIKFDDICSLNCLQYIQISSSNTDKLSDVQTFCSKTALNTNKQILNQNMKPDSILATSVSTSCDICVGLGIDECDDILTEAFIVQSDESRFVVEKGLFSVQCTDISDYFCQAYLDELFLTLDSLKRLSVLIPLCELGIFNVEEQGIIKKLDVELVDNGESVEATCEICGSMSDKDCRDYLTDLVLSLPDNTRLVIEKEIFGNDLCALANGEDCLSILDDYLLNLSDKDRLTILYDACTSNEIDESISLYNEKCELCLDLNSNDCLVTLTNSLSLFDDHTRVALEKAVIHESCDNLSEIECNEFIDSTFLSQSKLKRLAKLKQLCNAGLLKSVNKQEEVDESDKEDEVIILQSSSVNGLSLTVGFFAIGTVLIIAFFVKFSVRKQKRNYEKIFEKEVEL